MKVLKISDTLTLPIEAVTEKLGFLGRTGAGKTYAAQKLAEEMHRINAQFIAFDPVGKWWSLRLASDGVGPGLSIPVFGGIHGDVPLEPTGGKLIADVIVDRNISAVVDVSQFESDAQKTRFMTDFGNRFFFRKKSSPSAVHLFIEESQEFIPQNPQRDESMMLHVWTRIQKLGRNFGIGSSLISQRPQEVNKKVLNLTEVLFVFQLTGPQERKAVAWWIEEKGIDEDIASELPKLKPGCPHVWSPAWLQISEVIKVNRKETYDASSTPKVGARAEVKSLAPIDLENLRKDMSATIERAKQEDPRELRKQLVEAQRQISELQSAMGRSTVKVEVPVEIPVLKDGQITRLEKIVENLRTISDKFVGPIGEMAKQGISITDAIKKLSLQKQNPLPVRHSVQFDKKARLPVNTRHERRLSKAEQLDTKLSNPEQRILNAIAWMESIGITDPKQTAIAFLAGYSYGGGAFNNPRGALRTKGLIEYRGDSIALTDHGRPLATPLPYPLTVEEMHGRVLKILPGPERKLMEVVLSMYPNSITNEELADRAGYVVGGGAFNNPRGRLRTLGLIEYNNGLIKAKPFLFLE